MKKTVALLVLFAADVAAESFLIRNVTVHPVTGAEIAGASVLVTDGMIADIGPKIAVSKTTRVVDAKGLHLYPGMIDSATTLGLAEVSSVRETNDANEIGDFLPQLRALVAVNPASEHIPVARANGITAAIALPGGGVISGQAGLMHLDGWTWEEMEIQRSAAIHLKFPLLTTSSGSEPSDRYRRRIPYPEAKKNHEASLQKLRLFLEDARRYRKAKAGGAPMAARLEAMLPVLEGKIPLMITAERNRAIREALEFTRREELKVILAGCREFAPALLDEIKARRIPVILGETLALPLDEDDPYDAQFTLPVELYKTGVLFAFGTFDSSAVRNLPYQAAAAVPFGLPKEEALKAITINPARIWGVESKTGSIEKGKWADLILTDGDPLETKTQVKQMWIRGRAVNLESRHTRLYKQYLDRP